VLAHDAEQIRLLRERPVLPPASPDHIIETLDSLCARVCRGGRGR
jgi:hypothetical protein